MGLEALQLDANRVRARIEQDGLEVAPAVRDELLRLTCVSVLRNPHGRARNHSALVLDDAVDIASSLLRSRGHRRQHHDQGRSFAAFAWGTPPSAAIGRSSAA